MQKLISGGHHLLPLARIAFKMLSSGDKARVNHLEELAHCFVVKPITAVEDHTLYGKGLGQVLGGLSLPSPCRACRCPSQVHVNGTNQRAVTPVGSTGDVQK